MSRLPQWLLVTLPVLWLGCAAHTGAQAVAPELDSRTRDLATEIRRSIDLRIQGRDADERVKRIFREKRPNIQKPRLRPPSYLRSKDCWAADVDLTPLSPWNWGGGPTPDHIDGIRNSCTLISPRHVVMSTHTVDDREFDVLFVSKKNEQVVRTVVEVKRVLKTDISIGVLNEDVPASISYAKVMPATFLQYLNPALHGDLASFHLPMFTTDQIRFALVQELSGLQGTAWHVDAKAEQLLTADRRRFHERMVGNDSSNPCGFILGDEFVLMWAWHFATGGPGLGFYVEPINAVMQELGGGYQLTLYDLSGFTRYQP